MRDTFVCYINTTAAVKAACDICVTSSNVNAIIENLPNDKIYFLPDKLMGKNIQNAFLGKKHIEFYDGACYVHKKFTTTEIKQLRSIYPDLFVLAHPECTQEVVKQADVIGSTSQIINYVKTHSEKKSLFSS